MTNLASVILDNPAIDPASVAVTFEGRDMLHGEFRQRVNRLANALKEHGVAGGDRVCVLLGNCPQFLESFFAITAIGALYVPLNTLLTPGEHGLLMEDCGPVALISSPRFAATLDAIETASLRLIVLTEGAGPGQVDYEALINAASQEPALASMDADDDAAIVYTSGTTSLPKGVVLSHGGYLADWRNLRLALRPDAKSVNLQIAPLYHAAIVHSVLHLGCGARTILAPKFDPGFVLRTIPAEKVTHVFCVPTIIYDLMDHPDFHRTDFSSLRTLEYGAAPMTRARLEEALRTVGPVFHHAYGMTETTSHCCILGGLAHNEELGSIGKPLESCDMMIVDDDDAEAPPDTIGEILIRGPNILSRYWNRETESAAALKNGWLRSGDLGRMNERGFFFIVDRKKDMIISGGVNVYPKDIEEVIARHPSVAEVAVYGIPDSRWGEAIAAAIRLKPDTALDLDELQTSLSGQLGRHLQPKRLEIVDDFPRNGTGKIMKHMLRKQAADAQAHP
jgi:acyl-CoA synthetase (AMP-forming)/AMP-acid ligase II